MRIGGQHPFATPPNRRSPARRLRGRLLAPVTVWTAGNLEGSGEPQGPGGSGGPQGGSPVGRVPVNRGGAGLTVSSVLVADGEPARVLGLIDPTSALWEAARQAGAFVVHVLAAGDRALAERFAEVRPPVHGAFAGLEVTGSPWGPLLGGSRSWAGCRLAGSTPTGYAELVAGVIERLELADGEAPLAFLHGRYVSVGEPEEDA
jgi:3-hydroxy-9,10-secoandrosta-1,3,5(10)-triene-9,17-dione monooxygenase reductase component